MNLNLLRALIITITAYSAVSFADDTSSPENTTNTESGTPSEAVAKDDNSENAQPDPLPLNDLRKFADVFGKIKAAYVEEIDDQTLIKHAIRGMLNGLDPHSSYLEPVAYDDLKQNTSGSFGGLGIEVGMENGFVKVIAPIDETPAHLGGIEAGDLIIELDDKPVKGMSLSQAVEKMRGEVGTKIKIKLVRSGTREPIEMTLTRAEIKTPSVRSLILDEKYGYLRIAQFQANSGDQFANRLEKLKEENPELSGLIIDLRNNPGGVLQAAVQIADELLEEGLIVYTKGRSEIADLSFSATEGDALNGLPIIVLIDTGSASASEILAGALQDHKRAVIMGTQSFGKGSVQNVLQLDEDHALKLTTARYFTPNGRSIQAQGIVPDIVVNRAKLGDEQKPDFYREADLEGHLSNGNDSDNAGTQDEENGDDSNMKERLEKDFQLQEALSLLKAIDILKIDI
ncbi:MULTISPECIES: S41 family peptidase [unclassified Oleiphilus]|nr:MULTISPECIES: S41 family peptidase [unclassified Oleiphilus]KZY61757.1 peptidase S41 [Oleiphilus sp. HI0066]KZY70743.1 peptidase S41 [Oleiphilus sp. HI0067]